MFNPKSCLEHGCLHLGNEQEVNIRVETLGRIWSVERDRGHGGIYVGRDQHTVSSWIKHD